MTSEVAYELEADFYLLYTCNYRCAYCFFQPETLGQKIVIHADHDRWSEAFDRTGKPWLIHITGGEPSLYPQFAMLCQKLTQRHCISLNSNLSHKSIVEFSNRVDPSRVTFINAAFHVAERASRRGEALFLRHAGILRDQGFRIFVSLVVTPESIDQLGDIMAWFSAENLIAVPKLMRGMYRGKRYPTGYSHKEKALLSGYFALARRAMNERYASGDFDPTIDLFHDDGLLHELPSFYGKTCAAGSRFVRIEPDGRVYRCSQKTYMGNLLDGSLQLMSKPQMCDTHYCVYFCQKYSDPALTGSSAWRDSTAIPSAFRKIAHKLLT